MHGEWLQGDIVLTRRQAVLGGARDRPRNHGWQLRQIGPQIGVDNFALRGQLRFPKENKFTFITRQSPTWKAAILVTSGGDLNCSLYNLSGRLGLNINSRMFSAEIFGIASGNPEKSVEKSVAKDGSTYLAKKA